MASGVAVDPECITAFNELKLKHSLRYIVYCLTKDLKRIEVETKAPPTATYQDFEEEMKAAEQKQQCRFAVFDAEYDLPNGQKRNKIVFYIWCPDTATTKQKMVYTSSKDALKKCLVGIAKEVQCTDECELGWPNTLEILKRTEQGAH